MAKPRYVGVAPKRYKQKRARLWLFDFRGIQGRKPSKDMLRKMRQPYQSYRGNKPIFTSPEQLQLEIDQYFESCYGPLIDWKKNEVVYDKDGNTVRVQVKPFTVNGLAYWLGIPTETLDQITWGFQDDWNTTDEEKLYSAILKRAKQRIALYSEERLYDREGVVGAKFVLDHHFRAITNKEAAEIAAMNKNLEYKKQELEMKKQMLDLDDGDNSLNITIVRKDD